MPQYTDEDRYQLELRRRHLGDPKPSNRKILLLAANEEDLFRAPNGQVWLAPECSHGSRTYLPLRSPQFRHQALDSYFQQRAEFPSAADWRHALACWEAIAKPLRFPPDRRISGDGREQILWDNSGGIVPSSGCFHIRPGAWTDFDSGPGAFYRPPSAAHFRNLNYDPKPVFHSLLPLRALLRPASPADWHRIVIWLLAALRPNAPCPILVLQGPAASGKSIAARLLRNTIDPAAASPFLPLPSTESQLHRQAFDHYVLAFDHVTAMPRSLSDMLCRLATGASSSIGGYAQELKRPIILTVPDTAGWTPDPELARRLLVVNLAQIPEPEHLPASEIDERFDRQAQHPAVRILCDATAAALAAQQKAPAELDRAAWSKAAAPILQISPQEIERALEPVRRESPLVPAIAAFLESQPGRSWTGTASDLMDELPPAIRPTNEKVFGRRLNDLKPDFQAQGIALDKGREAPTRHVQFHMHTAENSCHLPPPQPFRPDWQNCPWPQSEAKDNPNPEPEPEPPPKPEPEPELEPEPAPEWENLEPGQTMPPITVQIERTPEQNTRELCELTQKLRQITRSPAEDAALHRARLHEAIREKQAARPPDPADITTIDWSPAEDAPEQQENPDAS